MDILDERADSRKFEKSMNIEIEFFENHEVKERAIQKYRNDALITP